MKKSPNIIIDSPQYTWKRRPSEIRGYQRAYYFTDESGDYLRVDYNLKEKRVRLYVEVDREGGNAYYSVISNGRITAEKSVSTGRSFGFSDKFRDRAESFSSLPNRDILKLINRNYGIDWRKADSRIADEERRKRLSETRKRYFKQEDVRGRSGSMAGEKLEWKLNLIDILDLGIGIMLSGAAFLIFRYNIMAMGVIAAFYGIIIGLVDMFFRNRSPVFTKVIFFLLIGIVLYVRGYFF